MNGLLELPTSLSLGSACPDLKETALDVGIGVGTFFVEYPLTGFIQNTVVSLMKNMGCQFTAQQDAIALLDDVCCIGSAGFFTQIPKILLIAYITIIGPIIEEVTFREGLHRTIEFCQGEPDSTTKKVVRCASNGLIFGACHLSFTQGWLNVPIFLVTGIMGIIFAVQREITGNIIASSTTHCLHNSTSIYQYFHC